MKTPGARGGCWALWWPEPG